mgnify:CR=1 FL=1
MVSFDSPFYPYEKVQDFNTLKGAEEIPYKILMYLLDLPDRHGYEPVDDNSRARVRLIKYLYYDEPNPLARPRNRSFHWYIPVMCRIPPR